MLATNACSGMFAHSKTDRRDFNPPPCRKCGCEHDLTRHHIYPRRFEFGDVIADKVIILCRDCHDRLEHVIRQHEKQHAKTNQRTQLPKYRYPHISLQFIT